jgi:hypothetical protein
MAHSHYIAALNAFFYLNQLSGNPDRTAEAGDPTVVQIATAHAQSNVFRISCWETVPYLVRLTRYPQKRREVPLRMRKMSYSRESAVGKLLPIR